MAKTIDGVQYSDDLETVLFVERGKAGVRIRDGARKIARGAFRLCVARRVELPGTLEEIGAGAFADCHRLAEIGIPTGVRSIGRQAFESCMGLSRISLPEGVEEIGAGAFISCSSLSDVSLPSTLAEIPMSLFAGCAIGRITIPEGVRKIGDDAFAACPLVEISLPDSLEEIGTYCFGSSETLSTVRLPPNMKSIPNGAFAPFSPETLTIEVDGGSKTEKIVMKSATLRRFLASVKRAKAKRDKVSEILRSGRDAILKDVTGASAVMCDVAKVSGERAEGNHVILRIEFGYAGELQVAVPKSLGKSLPELIELKSILSQIDADDEESLKAGLKKSVSCLKSFDTFLDSEERTYRFPAKQNAQSIQSVQKTMRNFGTNPYGLTFGAARLSFIFSHSALKRAAQAVGKNANLSACFDDDRDSPRGYGSLLFSAENRFLLVKIPQKLNPKRLAELSSFADSLGTEKKAFDALDRASAEHLGAFDYYADGRVHLGQGGTKVFSERAFTFLKPLKNPTVRALEIAAPYAKLADFALTKRRRTLLLLSLPNTLTLIGRSALSGCKSLSVIEYGGTVEEWSRIPKGALWRSEVRSKVKCADGEGE